jgi:hypothetical protein
MISIYQPKVLIEKDLDTQNVKQLHPKVVIRRLLGARTGRLGDHASGILVSRDLVTYIVAKAVK